MKKVLILSASYGEGHNAAGRGLLAALQQQGRAAAEMYDPYPEALGELYDRSRRDYLQMIEKHPAVWSVIYQLLHHTPLIHLSLPFLGKVRAALQRKIAGLQPDVVVSVYPIYPYLLAQLYKGKERPFRLYSVVTDSITINSAWYRSPSDRWLLPNEASAEVMRKAGVPTDKLRVLGFPVPPVFAQERPFRAAPGEGEPMRVLYMINADKGAAPALVSRLLQVEGISLSVTVGRDETLREAVDAAVRQSGRTAKLYGWTPHMPELLMSHHVLIGKAGGAAVQEAIAARTPMIVTKVVPGQEEGNARLLVENGCGAVCPSPELIAQKLEELRAGQAALWKSWESNLGKLSRPDAALRMAEMIVE